MNPTTVMSLPDAKLSQQQAEDEAQLASLGYRQEFKRDFKPAELFGLAFSLIGIVPSFSSVLVYAIPNGGSVAMVWGWAASSFFLLFIALAMAELGSAMPMSGGLYFWTYHFSSQRYCNVLSWIVGYTNSVAYISGLAGIDWGCAVQITAAISIGTDSSFVPTVHQTYGIYCALLFIHSIIASSATQVLARLTNFYIALNVLLCVAIIISVPIVTPSDLKNSASFTLGDFKNFNSWPNGYAFILSFLAPLWAISGFDSSVHISEEARNAKIAVPWAIISATVVGSIFGWALNLVVAFNMGDDIDNILNNPIGQPMAVILYNSFGKKGTLAIWSFIISSQFMMGISILVVSSRLNFAFARDGALPFSRFLYNMNARTGTPVNSVWTSAFLAALLGLLSFVGTTAIGAVFTLSVVAQYVSDTIPIVARFLGGREFKPGPFNLGAFSLPVAAIAVSWMLFMTVVLLFPSTPQTTPQEMNYSVVVFGGVMCMSLAYYYFPKYGGIYWFTGPISTIGSQELRNSGELDGNSSEKSVGSQNK